VPAAVPAAVPGVIPVTDPTPAAAPLTAGFPPSVMLTRWLGTTAVGDLWLIAAASDGQDAQDGQDGQDGQGVRGEGRAAGVLEVIDLARAERLGFDPQALDRVIAVRDPGLAVPAGVLATGLGPGVVLPPAIGRPLVLGTDVGDRAGFARAAGQLADALAALHAAGLTHNAIAGSLLCPGDHGEPTLAVTGSAACPGSPVGDVAALLAALPGLDPWVGTSVAAELGTPALADAPEPARALAERCRAYSTAGQPGVEAGVEAAAGDAAHVSVAAVPDADTLTAADDQTPEQTAEQTGGDAALPLPFGSWSPVITRGPAPLLADDLPAPRRPRAPGRAAAARRPDRASRRARPAAATATGRPLWARPPVLIAAAAAAAGLIAFDLHTSGTGTAGSGRSPAPTTTTPGTPPALSTAGAAAAPAQPAPPTPPAPPFAPATHPAGAAAPPARPWPPLPGAAATSAAVGAVTATVQLPARLVPTATAAPTTAAPVAPVADAPPARTSPAPAPAPRRSPVPAPVNTRTVPLPGTRSTPAGPPPPAAPAASGTVAPPR